MANLGVPVVVDGKQGGSGFPVVVGVVALILVIIGVVLWRKERAISKSLVNCTSSLRDSPAPTTASGGGCGSREEPPVPSIFESGSQNRHHHNSHTNPSSTVDSINGDSLHRSGGGNGSFKTGGSSNQTPRTVSWAVAPTSPRACGTTR